MELRSEQAMQAVKERELAAQADLMAQQSLRLQQQIQQDAKNEADTLLNAQIWKAEQAANKYTPDELDERAVHRMNIVNPVLGEKQAKALMELRRGKQELTQFTPQVVQPLDTSTGQPALDEEGKPLRMATTGRASAQVLNKTATAGMAFQLKAINQAKMDAQASGNEELAKLLQAGEAKMVESNRLSVKFDENGRISELVQGPQGAASPDALTKSNQTKVQESQAQSLATIDVANRLDPLISSETVGVKAFAESWIKDRVLAQAFPELASKKRVEAERLVAELRSRAVNELGTPPISDRERAEILKAVPGINEPVDSPARAKELLRQIKKMSAIRALVAAKRLGGAIPKAAAMALDDEALVDLHKQGLITTEQARQAYELKRQE